MSRFGHLRQANGKDFVVPVTLYGYTPPRRHDKLPKGLWQGDIIDAEGRESAEANGYNLHLTVRVVGEPEACAEYQGAELDAWIFMIYDDAIESMPEGKDRDKAQQAAEIGYQKLQHLSASVLSGKGAEVLEKFMQLGPDGKPLQIGVGPKSLVGKRVCFESEHGQKSTIMKDGRTRDFSELPRVRWFTTRENFEKAPGPFKADAAGPEQREAPEIGEAPQAATQQAAPARQAAQPARSNGSKAAAPAPTAPMGQAEVADLLAF